MARKPGGEAAIRARIAAAPGLGPEEGHRLAGLLEAECHLSIVPNNRDGWKCGCDVSLRDDDREILVDAQARLGLGNLAAISARNGSRPQVRWKVESKVECAALVDLLHQHQFRGRKLGEYEFWREAVGLWDARRYGMTSEGQSRLRGLASAIKDARVYREPAREAGLPDLSDPNAPYYFAGFFSGEGCFMLAPPRGARFVIKLRRDDRPLLEAFRNQFQLGSVRDVATPEPWSPAAVWHVTSARDVLQGIAVFESAGLLGRKRRQFLAWRPGAEAVAHAKIGRKPVDARAVTMARRALHSATAYTPPDEPLAWTGGTRI